MNPATRCSTQHFTGVFAIKGDHLPLAGWPYSTSSELHKRFTHPLLGISMEFCFGDKPVGISTAYLFRCDRLGYSMPLRRHQHGFSCGDKTLRSLTASTITPSGENPGPPLLWLSSFPSRPVPTAGFPTRRASERLSHRTPGMLPCPPPVHHSCWYFHPRHPCYRLVHRRPPPSRDAVACLRRARAGIRPTRGGALFGDGRRRRGGRRS